MKKILLATIIGLAFFTPLHAQEKKLIQGFDGGMMVHSGFLRGTIGPDEIPANGTPFGIGGVIRLHLSKNFRIGSEGYVSTLNQRGNGSYVKYGWGGILADIYSVFGRFQPYAGITLGGGAATTLLMDESPNTAWAPINGTLYHKQGFMALDPYIGCDYIVGKAMHLTFKADTLHCFSKEGLLPIGPRVYFGFLFYH